MMSTIRKLNSKVSLLLLLLICMVSIISYPLQANEVKVYDYANLFTLDEVENLETTISSILANYQIDVGIVTTDDVEGKTTMAYADDFYDKQGYGVGSNTDGLLFLIDMDNRVPHISTCGLAIRYFTDARIEHMLDTVYDYLADGDFYGAASAFLSQVQGYLDSGIPDNQHNISVTPPHVPFKNQYGEPLNITSILLSIVSAAISAFIIALITRYIIAYRYKKPRYTTQQTRPDDMSIHYTQREDRFVTSHTSRVKIQTNNNPHGSGGSSGASSVHHSSSGRSHGGGTGRKF